MFKMIYKLTDKIKEALSQKGQGMVEYGIVLAVVAAIAAVVFWGEKGDGGLQKSVESAYSTATGTINKAVTKANNAAGDATQIKDTQDDDNQNS